MEVLNWWLANVKDGMWVNKLKLNLGKAELILVSSRADSELGIKYVLDRFALPLKD